MRSLTREEREWLGLSEDTSLEPLDSRREEGAEEPQGAFGARTLAAIATWLAANFGNQPPDPISFRGMEERVGSFRIYQVDRGVCLFDNRSSNVAVRGLHQEVLLDGERYLLVDARNERADVALFGDKGTGLVRLADRGQELALVGSPELERRAASTAHAVNVDVPDLSVIGGPIPSEAWLFSLASERASSERGVWRTSAVGTWGRLWSPPSGADHAVLEALVTSAGPAQRALDWFAAQPRPVIRQVLEDAAREAEKLRNELALLEQRVLEDPDEAREGLRQWLHVRDDLESVRFLSEDLPEGAPLRGALVALDNEAATYHSMYLDVEPFEDDDRLAAVAFADPDAWWGKVAGL